MMKHFMKFMAIYALVATMFSVGCDDDPVVEPVKDPPTITVNNPELITDTMYVDDVNFQSISVSAVKGTGKLTQISVNEDGSPMTDFDRLGFGGINTTPTSHVYTVETTEEDSLTMGIYIKAPATVGSYTYEFTVVDENTKSASTSVTLTVIEGFSGTALSASITGRLSNRAGPAGTGGINLLTGEETGSSTAGSHLRDEGSVDPWVKKISGINGSVIRTPAETIDFDAVDTKEAIMEAWNAGTETAVTDALAGGEIFIVQNGDDTFLIRIDEVVEVAADNSDHYNMSIKY